MVAFSAMCIASAACAVYVTADLIIKGVRNYKNNEQNSGK